jgi:hypothetical protein
MKKYFLGGIIVLAVVAIWLSWSQGQVVPQGGGGDLPAFYGTAKDGRTVTACKKPNMFPCKSANATGENWYIIYLPTGNPTWYGTYIVDDGTGCTPQEGNWNPSHSGTRIDFCTGEPSQCPCQQALVKLSRWITLSLDGQCDPLFCSLEKRLTFVGFYGQGGV